MPTIPAKDPFQLRVTGSVSDPHSFNPDADTDLDLVKFKEIIIFSFL
jgi:hypothetical protein